MAIYIELFHGRNSLDEDLSDWGFDGPVFQGDQFHVTYGTHIRFDCDTDEKSLSVVDGCIYYDGKFYGDWSFFDYGVLVNDGRELDKRLTTWEQEKATPPSDEMDE